MVQFSDISSFFLCKTVIFLVSPSAGHLRSCSTSFRWDRTPAGPAHRVPLLAFAPKICSLCWNGKGGDVIFEIVEIAKFITSWVISRGRYCHPQYLQTWNGEDQYRLVIVGYLGHLQCWLPALDRRMNMVCCDWQRWDLKWQWILFDGRTTSLAWCVAVPRNVTNVSYFLAMFVSRNRNGYGSLPHPEKSRDPKMPKWSKLRIQEATTELLQLLDSKVLSPVAESFSLSVDSSPLPVQTSSTIIRYC